MDNEMLGKAYNSYLLALHSKILLQKRNKKIADEINVQNEALRNEKAEAAVLLEELQDRCKRISDLSAQLKTFDICEQFCKEAGSDVCKFVLSLSQLQDYLEEKVNFLQFKNMKFSEDSVENVHFQLTELMKTLDAGVLQNSQCLKSCTAEKICKIHSQIMQAKDDIKRCTRLLHTLPELIMRCYTVA